MRDKEHRSTSATIYSSKFNLIDQSILNRELEYIDTFRLREEIR